MDEQPIFSVTAQDSPVKLFLEERVVSGDQTPKAIVATSVLDRFCLDSPNTSPKKQTVDIQKARNVDISSEINAFRELKARLSILKESENNYAPEETLGETPKKAESPITGEEVAGKPESPVLRVETIPLKASSPMKPVVASPVFLSRSPSPRKISTVLATSPKKAPPATSAVRVPTCAVSPKKPTAIFRKSSELLQEKTILKRSNTVSTRLRSPSTNKSAFKPLFSMFGKKDKEPTLSAQEKNEMDDMEAKLALLEIAPEQQPKKQPEQASGLRRSSTVHRSKLPVSKLPVRPSTKLPYPAPATTDASEGLIRSKTISAGRRFGFSK
jgi:hypothetical protein